MQLEDPLYPYFKDVYRRAKLLQMVVVRNEKEIPLLHLIDEILDEDAERLNRIMVKEFTFT